MNFIVAIKKRPIRKEKKTFFSFFFFQKAERSAALTHISFSELS
jgi:hypothetical protein